MDGLLHITDMSWGRINHPSEMVAIGQKLDVVILDVNKRERARFPRSQANAGQPLGSIEAVPQSAWNVGREKSPNSCLTVPSWSSRRVSKVSSTSPNSPGSSASPVLPTCSPLGQEVKASSRHQQGRAEDLPRRAPARNQSMGRDRRPLPDRQQIKGKSATSPPTAPSWSWKKASTA
jgi:hypothetical protein